MNKTVETSQLEIQPLGGRLGCELVGLDLSRSITDELFQAVLDAFHQYSLLLVRDQNLHPDQIVCLSRGFGELEKHVEAPYLLDGYQDIVVIGNLVIDGEMRSLFVNGREEWHFDYAFAAKPSIGALFYAVTVPPEGGDTLFADMSAAYTALDEQQKVRIAELCAVHSYERLDAHLRTMDPTRPALSDEDKRRWPPVSHPIVHSHPVTGRKSIRIAPEVITDVEGLSTREGEQLIAELLAHSTQPQFVYRQEWREGDLLIFDNRCVLHTATVFDSEKYLRVMYRTTIMQ